MSHSNKFKKAPLLIISLFFLMGIILFLFAGLDEDDPTIVHVGRTNMIILDGGNLQEIQDEIVGYARGLVSAEELLNYDISYDEDITEHRVIFNYIVRENQYEGLLSVHCEYDGKWSIVSVTQTEIDSDLYRSQFAHLVDKEIEEKNRIIKEYISANYPQPQNISVTIYGSTARLRDNHGGERLEEREFVFDIGDDEPARVW